MVISGSLQQCICSVLIHIVILIHVVLIYGLQSLMAPSELIEGQLGDPTEYIPETDETLLVCNPRKPTSSSAHCCGSHHMSGFHGLGC